MRIKEFIARLEKFKNATEDLKICIYYSQCNNRNNYLDIIGILGNEEKAGIAFLKDKEAIIEPGKNNTTISCLIKMLTDFLDEKGNAELNVYLIEDRRLPTFYKVLPVLAFLNFITKEDIKFATILVAESQKVADELWENYQQIKQEDSNIKEV